MVHDGKGGLQRLTSALAVIDGTKLRARAGIRALIPNIVYVKKDFSENIFGFLNERPEPSLQRRSSGNGGIRGLYIILVGHHLSTCNILDWG